MPHVLASDHGRTAQAEPIVLPASRGTGVDMEDPAVLRAVLDHASTCYAILDGRDQRCTYANAAFRNCGVVPGAVLTQAFPAIDRTLLDEATASRQPQKRRNGSWELEATPLCGTDGEVRGILVSARAANDSRLTAEELAATLAERDKQMREVSHRVKNTLQLVSSLMTLQALTTKDPVMRGAFQEAGGRISTVTQAHQRVHMAEREKEVKVDFGQYLRDLCAEMEAGASMSGPERRIVATADRVSLPPESVIPLALIVNELVNNALKYAYPPGVPGDVEVGLHALPEGGYRLSVSDHGRGLPPGFDPVRSDTLGMKVIRAFAGQLKGKLRAEDGGPGARFSVDLPG
ncbi:PAS domain-containing sensor histidine kinase [Azospirillum sp. SYSU D00513]|uniref:sensor histidine kinase n=1 Tax=Azospirillum sp. SYSU D00513 TaxID=2812561 RepID=UPI001FFFD376|nr:PAS domain-containing sensor histidine kinase [Azospirillum sp. SYSU D00513]